MISTQGNWEAVSILEFRLGLSNEPLESTFQKGSIPQLSLERLGFEASMNWIECIEFRTETVRVELAKLEQELDLC